MVIRLKGKIIHRWYDENTEPHTEIELPPISRKPEVGELVLCVGEVYSDELNPIGVRFKGGKIIDGGVVKNIVAILPKEEKKCSCKKTEDMKSWVQFDNCPIHGNKVEE